jgi:elongation factor Ts
MAITAEDVKSLRESTGAGMMDCKKALNETNGNLEEAVKWLRERGITKAAKRGGRVAAEGAVGSYIHMGGKIGVLVEVNCETDFVGKGEIFQQFVKDVCLQIASASPQWVRPEEVPADAVAAEKQVYAGQAKEEGKPEAMWDKIGEGRLKKWYSEVCLLNQKFVKDPDRTIEQLATEVSGRTGEKVEIRRFVRYQLGEGIEKQESNFAEEVAAELRKAEEKAKA